MIVEAVQKLDTVREREKLNDVYSVYGYNEPGGAPHQYIVVKSGQDADDEDNHLMKICIFC